MTDRNEALDATTAAHGYDVDLEVQEAAYMTGFVNRDEQKAAFRVGNDEAILEITLDLPALEELIERLETNADELNNVIIADGAADELSAHVASGLDDGSAYPVMQLLYSWVEDQGLWAEFAMWAEAVIANQGLLNTPEPTTDDEDEQVGEWLDGWA